MTGASNALQTRLSALIVRTLVSSCFRIAAHPGSPGQEIGRYKLLEQIGKGGMGVVFVAEQTEPVCRRVALKIIKPGMDSQQVIARFEAERQALAMMEHPNIAKILDAGTVGQSTKLQAANYKLQTNSKQQIDSIMEQPSRDTEPIIWPHQSSLNPSVSV